MAQGKESASKSRRNSKNTIYKNIFILQKEWGRELIKKYVEQSKIENKIPLFPLSKIEIHPSGGCNFNCGFCYGKLLAPNERTNLSSSAVNAMLADVKENLPKENPLIILSGLYSEPLFNPETKKMIKSIGEHGYRLGLYTNGVLLDDELIELIISAAKNAKSDLPSYVSFNVSGAIDNNNFKKQISLIKDLSKAKKIAKLDSNKFIINAPLLIEDLTPKGIKLVEKTIKTLRKAGAENIRLSLAWDKLELVLRADNFKQKRKNFNKLKKFADKFKEVYVRRSIPQRDYARCYSLARSLIISPEGLIFACPEKCTPLLKEKYSYGSIMTEKVSDVWHGKKHNALFKKLIPKLENCKCCPINNKFNSFCSKQ